MSALYSVKNWDLHYENSESRKVRNCKYVCTPNKHDGSGYGRMMAHPEGERLFAAWNAIIQVASKMPSRGVLKDQDGVLAASDLAFKTRMRVETFEMALAFFSSPEIGWLACEVLKSEQKEQSPETSGAFPGAPGKNGVEGKGREGKGSIPPLPPEEFREWKESIPRIFRFTPTSHRDELRVFSAFEGFRGKGAGIQEVERVAARAREIWEPHMVTPEAVLNQWDFLRQGKKSETRKTLPVLE